MATLDPPLQADVAAHAFLAAVDAGEIEQSQLAQDRAITEAVRTFADHMVADHSRALEQRERRMATAGLGLRFSTPIATGSAAYTGVGEPTNAQGIVLNSMPEGGTGTTGTNLGPASIGTSPEHPAGSADAQGAVAGDAPQAGAAGTNLGEVYGPHPAEPEVVGAAADAFTAREVRTQAGMAELSELLLRNPYSRPVAEHAMTDLVTLQQLTGAEFERAYMDRQVAAHQVALDRLERTLAQNRLSGGMEKLLIAQRDAVAGHLRVAQQIRAGLR